MEECIVEIEAEEENLTSTKILFFLFKRRLELIEDWTLILQRSIVGIGERGDRYY